MGVALAVIAIAVAAAFANIALLGSAGEDRLGRLLPVSGQADSAHAAATDDDGMGGDAVIPGSAITGGGAVTTTDDHGGRVRDHDEDD